jgi:endonuclease G
VLYDDRNGASIAATEVKAWFGYERTLDGVQLSPNVLTGDPATIIGDRRHDWAVITVPEPMPDDAPIIQANGASPVNIDDRVYIIQHPGGAPKKIGMIHNVVRYVDDEVMQYFTDTEKGSSGSPVFNEQWQLVAMHHRWVEVKGDGDVPEFRNQGRRIERIVEGMQAEGVI